jgi:hypothetical protein
MDPIHPIRPVSSNPAAVDAVRRLARIGDEPREEQSPPRERRKAPAPAPPQPGVTADGHLDTRA